jgi:hypothetical protein
LVVGQAVRPIEPDVERLEKLEIYFEYFNVGVRYGLTFKQFEQKVDDESWQQFLEERMTLNPLVRELCNSR